MTERVSASRSRWKSWPLGLIFVAAVGFYFWSTHASLPAWTDPAPSGYYGLQTEAFRAGQLHLKLEPHPQLLRLPDPYDPVANAPYRVHDMSLYQGRYYVYFGITPILVLMLPWNLLTGTYLTEPFVVALFGTAGLAISLLWLQALRRRLFPEGSVTVLTAGAAVLALGNLVPALMQAPGFYQVPMACAYAFGFLAAYLACRSLWSGHRPALWLAAASLAWGLAVAARPNYLPGSLLLLIPWWWRVQWTRDVRRMLRPDSLRLLLAAVVPLGLVGVGLMAYNHARFGSITEFGMTYQLASFRIADQPLMGLGNLLPNLWGYLFSVPRWSRYFPFIVPGADQLPLGALSVFPFFWLGAFALYRLYRQPGGWRTEVGGVAAIVAVPMAGALLFLSLYFALILRYSADFILWMAFGSAVAALTFEQRVRAARPRLRPWLVAGVVLAAAITVAVNLAYALRAFPDQSRLAPLARAMNTPAYVWERLTGAQYGPIRMEVSFPSGQAGTTEPLISTGAYPSETDLVFVRYLSGERVQFGYFHSGLGGPTSAPMRLGPGPHQVEIFLGSFAPPEEHPFFEGWSPLRVASVRRSVEVTVNGERVLQAAANFYPSSPGLLAVGRNPNSIGDIASRFTGSITNEVQLPIQADDFQAPELRAGRPIRLKVIFPAGRAGSAEPLLQTGSRGASDLVYVSYREGNRVAFGLDHWGGGGPRSEAMEIDPTAEHDLVVWVGPLSGESGETAAPASEGGTVAPSRRLVVSLNGRVLLDADQPFYPSTIEQAVIGVNALNHSAAGPMFSGRITAVTNAAMDDLPPSVSWQGWGDVRMVVAFPQNMTGQVEPLVTTGATGAGDFLYVRYVDAHHVRFGLDHWMFGGEESEPVEINYDLPHRLELEMDALRPPDQPRSGQVRVTMNGRVVLDTRSASHPAGPEQVWIGRNPIGGSTTSERFTGRILLLRRGEALP